MFVWVVDVLLRCILGGCDWIVLVVLGLAGCCFAFVVRLADCLYV